MSKIEVGMLVEVIYTNSEYSRHLGHIGIILYASTEHPDSWAVEGVIEEGRQAVVGSNSLRPINPDSEPADEDFQEDLKRWLGKKVTA